MKKNNPSKIIEIAQNYGCTLTQKCQKLMLPSFTLIIKQNYYDHFSYQWCKNWTRDELQEVIVLLSLHRKKYSVHQCTFFFLFLIGSISLNIRNILLLHTAGEVTEDSEKSLSSGWNFLDLFKLPRRNLIYQCHANIKMELKYEKNYISLKTCEHMHAKKLSHLWLWDSDT